eukprot:83775-Hanusia_phi.AAC.1
MRRIVACEIAKYFAKTGLRLPEALRGAPDRHGDAEALALLMLAFDIKTMGLDPRHHDITVAAVYDPQALIQLRQARRGQGRAAREREVEAFLRALDEAELLC